MGVFWGAKLTPFGQKNLLIGDVGAQYVTFLSYFRHILTNFDFSFYSFSLGLGDNFFPVFSYYLISPFNLLVLLFPANRVPEALSVIIILKIATISLSTAYFFKKKYQQYQFSNLIFSTIFSLSGFVALYFYNLMWLDALIILPFVILGIEQLFYRQKSALYVVSLLLVIVTNYYMGYMMCFFSVVYFSYLCLLNRLFNKKIVGKYLMASLTSGLLSAVVLLPTVLAMLQTSKQKMDLNNFLPTPEYGWSSLIQFGVVGNTVAKRISHGPELFVTSLGLIFLISFFGNNRISKQHKIAAVYILTVLFLGMFILTFNTIWHMFQPPVGLHFRNVYFFSFLAIMFASESYQVGVTKYNLIISASLSTFLLIIGYYFAIKNHQYISINNLYLGLGFIVLSTTFLELSNHRNGFKYLLALVVGSELLINFLGGLQGSQFGQEDLYQKDYQTEAQMYQKVARHDKGFYRIVNVNPSIDRSDYIPDSNNNDPLIFGSDGVSLYSSTLNSRVRQMMLDLGYYGRNIRSISPNNGTKLTDALFGVKYRINGPEILQSDALGLGTVVNQDLTKVKLNSETPIVNQEKLWNASNQTPQQYFTKPRISGTSVTSSIKGTLYFVNRDNISDIVVNGRKIPVDEYEHNNVIDLGKINVDDEVKVKIIDASSNSPKDFYVLNDQKLKQSVKLLNRQTLHLQSSFGNHQITGTVHIKNNQQILFLNIPYDKGWTAVVDGKRQIIKPVLGGMSSLKLTPGEHQIVLKYRVPGLKIGMIVSVLVLTFYILSFVKNNKNH